MIFILFLFLNSKAAAIANKIKLIIFTDPTIVINIPRPETKNKKAAISVSFEDNFIANKPDMENIIEPRKASESHGLINIATIKI